MDYYPFGLQWHKPGSFIKDLNSTNNKYWHTTKEMQTDEWDNVHGLDLEDFGARMYDPIVARWWSVDSKARDMVRWSEYSSNFNNPMNFIDPNGKEPTPLEAAQIAAHVYGDYSDKILSGGWRVSQNQEIAARYTKTSSSGLQSAVYERVVNGVVTEYVYATAGTNESKDWWSNGLQPPGFAKQYEESAENAKNLSNYLGTAELTFVGHSLGGGEAAENALITDKNAVTFNAAGVSSVTLAENGDWTTPLKPEWNILAFYELSDPLTIVQKTLWYTLPQPNGIGIPLIPRSSSTWYNGHSIESILNSFGINVDEFKKTY